jgi:hypothetical protein
MRTPWLVAKVLRCQGFGAHACALRLQVGVLTQHLGALESEYEALRDEFRAVTDDLEAMVKENQVCRPFVAAFPMMLHYTLAVAARFARAGHCHVWP